MSAVPAGVALRTLEPVDWPEVERIYAEGIATRMATFETATPSWEDWNAGHLRAPRLVATLEGEMVGWAALSPVSGRCVYAGVAEPLVADDIADCVAWCATRPHHVNIDRLVVRPLAQAAQHKVHRV